MSEKLNVYRAFDEEKIGEITRDSKASLAQKLNAARTIVDSQKFLRPSERINILSAARELMKIRKNELIEVACHEGGKPLVDTQVEMERAINGVQLAIEAIGQLKGEQVPMGLTPSSEGRFAFTFREPIGVVAAISAFNHPINLIIHQAITAVAAGCPVIVKPALTTPLSCLLVQEIIIQAGLPQAYFQVLIGDNDLAESLATSDQINFLSFIGSAKVGWYLRSKLAPGVRCALEHGGSAPVIIEKDADFNALIPAILKGGFYHAGQVCVSVQRVYVHDDIATQLAGALAEGASQLVVDDPINEKTAIGPLISKQELERVETWVKQAISEGAELICGGKRLSDTCYAPTILLNPNPNSKVSQEEVFGPVICIYSYHSTSEAIEGANALPFHFQAAVWTNDINTAMARMKQLNATTVLINDHTAFRVDWMPFGGRSSSGLGLGGILHSMKEMTQEKLVVIKSEVL